MSDFWHFAKRLLRYRRLLGLGLSAALLDALCGFAGFGVLLWLIRTFFRTESEGAETVHSVHAIVSEKLANPTLQQWVGDVTWLATYVPESRFGGFAFLLGVILVLALIGSVMRFTHQISIVTVSLRTIMGIRKDAFHRLIHTPMPALLSHDSSDNLSRVVRDAAAMGRGFTTLFAKAVRDVLTGLALFVWALIIDWQLTALFLISAPIVYTCIRKFGKRVRRATKYAMRAYGDMVGLIQESVGGLGVVKVHGAEGYERRRFNRVNRQVLKQELRARIARALSPPVVELVGIVAVMGVALAAAWWVIHGPSEPAAMGFVVGSLCLAGASLKPLAGLNNNLQESAAAATRLRELLALPVEANAPFAAESGLTALPRHQQRVAFEGVSFTYPGSERPAIEGIDLTASHGETVAIVGPNGSGKTTLLSLLPRLLKPDAGRLRIDGYDIRQVTLRSLRGQMAMVTQQTVLFEGTIADNIAYGHPEATRAQVAEAARAALADGFITALPDGYDSWLGEGGTGLSGGQRQRLAIARAILRDPAILILDEATSQIDAASEERITEALSRFRLGRTTFVIAHRLSTVIDADRIVVMQDGRIVDAGTHDALLERSEVYRSLTRRQLQPAST